jgi:hypothetical protein
MRFKSVDLPEPDGPTRETISPRAISRLMSSSATTLRLPLNCLVTCRREITCWDKWGWQVDSVFSRTRPQSILQRTLARDSRPLWGSLSRPRNALQRVQPAGSRPRAGMPRPAFGKRSVM